MIEGDGYGSLMVFMVGTRPLLRNSDVASREGCKPPRHEKFRVGQ